jgi:hypothetical protein
MSASIDHYKNHERIKRLKMRSSYGIIYECLWLKVPGKQTVEVEFIDRILNFKQNIERHPTFLLLRDSIISTPRKVWYRNCEMDCGLDVFAEMAKPEHLLARSLSQLQIQKEREILYTHTAEVHPVSRTERERNVVHVHC